MNATSTHRGTVHFDHDAKEDRYVMTVEIPAQMLAEIGRKPLGERRTLLELAVERVLREAGVVR